MKGITISNRALCALCVACICTCSCSRKTAASSARNDATQSNEAAASGSAGAKRAASPSAPGQPIDVVAAVRQAIASNEGILSAKAIQISYEHGIVKLKGKVAEANEIWEAGNEAMKVEGIQGVANCLTAEKYSWGSPAQPLASHEGEIDAMFQAIRADPRIKGKIQIKFEASNPALKAFSRALTSPDGSFSVSGSVADEDQRIAVVNHMRTISDGAGSSAIDVPHDRLAESNANSSPAPWNGPAAPAKPIIPMCPGLTLVTAIAGSEGDYESIKTVESVEPKQVRLKYSAEYMSRPWWETPHPEFRKDVIYRTVLSGDSESAHKYDYIFEKIAPESTPGSTAIGTSIAVLKELKERGVSEFKLCDSFMGGGCSGTGTGAFSKLRRIENEPVRVSVLVNGVPTELPAVHSVEQRGLVRDEFFFLDDERNPVTLKFRLGIGAVPALTPHQRERCENARTKGEYFSVSTDQSDVYPESCDLPDGGDGSTLRVVKIDTRCEPASESAQSTPGTGDAGGTAAMEKSLAETGKVDIYSIYFSFNRDLVRDESEPTLKEIAEVLRRHSDWRLRIAGHTDGIGGDEQNLDLSKRRAAAVKEALVKKYGIGASRLETTGFGKSQPKDTNDTLEGRSHNRRVELMKIG